MPNLENKRGKPTYIVEFNPIEYKLGMVHNSKGNKPN